LLGTTRLSRAILAYHPGVAFPPQVRWPGRWSRPVAMRCPNCQDNTPKPLVVSVTWKPVQEPANTIRVLRCPACTACFFEDQKPPDYTEPTLLERGRVPFYLQQGAGLSLITRPLACIERPPGSTYLEVGCGFGFGIDFAAHAKGWRASGIDPAPLSAVGRELLGADIALRYLVGEDAAAHDCDVIMSSETVEHVRSPRDFVRVLRWALKPGGVLVLTTPDADAVRPETPEGALIPLLSPGLHLTLQSETSLRALLREAGFRHVEIEHDAYSLLAFASDAPLTLTRDPRAIRAIYRDYLEARAAAMPEDGDLFLGTAGQGVLEAVNDSEDGQAARIFARLSDVCARRFGIDLDAPVIPHAAWTASLEELARLVPLNLAVLMYARAMMSLRSGDDARAEACLRTCTQAAAIMRRALADIAIADGLTEDVGWAASAELCLCVAGRGAAEAIEMVRQLPDPPGGAAAIGRKRDILARALTLLVTRGHYGLASELIAMTGLRDWDWVEGDMPPAGPVARDALYCLAILAVQPGGDAGRALGYLRRVREAPARRRPARACSPTSCAPSSACCARPDACRRRTHCVIGTRGARSPSRRRSGGLLRGTVSAGRPTGG